MEDPYKEKIKLCVCVCCYSTFRVQWVYYSTLIHLLQRQNLSHTHCGVSRWPWWKQNHTLARWRSRPGSCYRTEWPKGRIVNGGNETHVPERVRNGLTDIKWDGAQPRLGPRLRPWRRSSGRSWRRVEAMIKWPMRSRLNISVCVCSLDYDAYDVIRIDGTWLGQTRCLVCAACVSVSRLIDAAVRFKAHNPSPTLLTFLLIYLIIDWLIYCTIWWWGERHIDCTIVCVCVCSHNRERNLSLFVVVRAALWI